MNRRSVTAAIVAASIIGLLPFTASARKSHAMHHGMGMHMAMKMTPQAMRYRKSLDAAKQHAASKGHYSCCIKPTCDWCMTHMGKCMCAKGAASEGQMPVCRECKGGWDAGEGAIPGVKASEVKVMKGMAMEGKATAKPAQKVAVLQVSGMI